jgi:N-acetylated-alpha-linked acidic dipeptidase
MALALVGPGAVAQQPSPGAAGAPAAAPAATKDASAKALLGFTDAAAERQRTLEATFDASLKADNLKAWLTRIAARPHHVGSAYGKENAEFMAGLFRSWGYETTIEQYDVLFPTPITRVVELVSPEKYTAKLSEPSLKEDSTSGQTSEQLPVYNAYSADGDVTADLVYVNYGIPRDYEMLAERGIDVKGKIVIARYGGSWRGIKPKVAAEHGAIGCLIYSDPRDDGYFQGDVYPKGPYRAEYGAQRGSVADMPVFPGDPLTPNVGATKDAKRLSREEAPTIMKIPVLPISYADAQPLLRALAGPVAPEAWRGALPLTYHLGPGPAKVHLKLQFDWKLAPAYDVIAKMRGAELPDEWIIRGNHHDGWVNGAADPVSGMVALMEEARAISELAKSGWKPKRTIVFAGWDAEEPGLLGSTEWVEAHADDLRRHAVVYINSDGNGRGFLEMGGSHSLEAFMNQVGRDVIDPQKNISVLERRRALQIVRGTPEESREVRTRSDLRISALGSGSDYTPFLQHLGVASLNIGFGGEDGNGSYHSIFDSIDLFNRFVDPGFSYGIALAKMGGRTTLRFANAELLPFQFAPLSETIDRYLREVTKLADDLRDQTAETNRRLADKTLLAVADARETYVPPAAKEPVPYFDFSGLQNALARLQDRAKAYDAAAQALTAAGGTGVSQSVQRSIGPLLLQAERTLTSTQGLPRRPWFTHQIYAPGFYTGYGVKTLPGVREAIEQRAWKEVTQQAAATAEAIDRLAVHLQRATDVLKGMTPSQ